MDGAGETQFHLGAGVGGTGPALEFRRQQGVGPGLGRPLVVGQPHDPQGVEFQTGAFQDAEDLKGGGAPGLGLEDLLAGAAGQAGGGFAGADGA